MDNDYSTTVQKVSFEWSSIKYSDVYPSGMWTGGLGHHQRKLIKNGYEANQNILRHICAWRRFPSNTVSSVIVWGPHHPVSMSPLLIGRVAIVN